MTTTPAPLPSDTHVRLPALILSLATASLVVGMAADLEVGRLLAAALAPCAAVAVAESKRREASAAASRLRSERDHVHHLARHDALTGLLNRMGLVDVLDAHLHASDGSLLVQFLDLDRFKEVNDVHGHAAGDQVLAAVAARATDALRGDEIVARLAGDEFVVVIPGVGDRDADQSIADRIEQAIVGAPLTVVGDHGAVRLQLAVSIGIARSAPGDDAQRLLGRADAAMYEHKRRSHASDASAAISSIDDVVEVATFDGASGPRMSLAGRVAPSVRSARSLASLRDAVVPVGAAHAHA